jgi:microcystin-dependent protein
MHRIDGPAAAPGGYFTEGDPAVGTPATVVTDDWMNAVQGEIEAVVVAGGLSLAKPDNTQMVQAIRALVAAAMPAGAVQPFARATAPAGWLVCDGSAVSRSAYPALWAAVGVTFGAGDGSTTFALPDLRGEFIRGVDGGRGVDAGRVLGSVQPWSTGRPRTTSAVALTDGGGTRQPSDESGPVSAGNSTIGFVRVAKSGNSATASDADGTGAGVEMDVFNVVDGDTETRPRNVALLYCIKA